MASINTLAHTHTQTHWYTSLMEITIVNTWNLLWNVPHPLRCSFSRGHMKTFNNTELFMGSEHPHMLTVPKYSTISNANTRSPCSDWIKVFIFDLSRNRIVGSGTLEPSWNEQPDGDFCWICGSELVGSDRFLLRILSSRRLNLKKKKSFKCKMFRCSGEFPRCKKQSLKMKKPDSKNEKLLSGRTMLR